MRKESHHPTGRRSAATRSLPDRHPQPPLAGGSAPAARAALNAAEFSLAPRLGPPAAAPPNFASSAGEPRPHRAGRRASSLATQSRRPGLPASRRRTDETPTPPRSRDPRTVRHRRPDRRLRRPGRSPSAAPPSPPAGSPASRRRKSKRSPRSTPASREPRAPGAAGPQGPAGANGKDGAAGDQAATGATSPRVRPARRVTRATRPRTDHRLLHRRGRNSAQRRALQRRRRHRTRSRRFR